MYQILYGILYLFSLLPLGVLYGFSKILYIFLYYIIRYRKKVIVRNLKNSFPEKSKTEIQIIRKQFYKNFSDYLVETLKCFSISSSELEQRHTFSNLEVFVDCKREGKDVLLM